MSRNRFEPGDPVWVVVPDREGLAGVVERNLGGGLPLVGCVTVRVRGVGAEGGAGQAMIVGTAMLRRRTAEGPGSIPPPASMLREVQ